MNERVTTPRLLAILAVSLGALMVVAIVGSFIFAGQVADRAAARVDARSAARGEARVAEEVRACERGNVLRAFALLDRRAQGGHEGYRRARHVSPILDCVLTYRDGHGKDVPLSPSAQAAYLRAIEDGRRPVVVDGIVR